MLLLLLLLLMSQQQQQQYIFVCQATCLPKTCSFICILLELVARDFNYEFRMIRQQRTKVRKSLCSLCLFAFVRSLARSTSSVLIWPLKPEMKLLVVLCVCVRRVRRARQCKLFIIIVVVVVLIIYYFEFQFELSLRVLACKFASRFLVGKEFGSNCESSIQLINFSKRNYRY